MADELIKLIQKIFDKNNRRIPVPEHRTIVTIFLNYDKPRLSDRYTIS